VSEDELWLSVAEQIGMRVVRVPESTIVGAGFSALKRAIEPPQITSPKTQVWIAGEREGLGVVIRLEALADGMKYVISVEIAPPLFVGLRMFTHGFMRFGPQAGPADDPGWAELVVYSRDPLRARALLDPHGGASLYTPVHTLKAFGPVAIHDAAVESFLPHAADPIRVSIAVDAAVLVARAFSQRSRATPPSKSDETLRASWERYATEQGLSFDWPRRRMHGEDIEIVLEPLPLGALTTMRVRFATPLGAGLHLRRDARGRFVALKSPIADAIQVGDAEFDAQFVIDAANADRARHVLRTDELRRILADLASSCVDVLMNDREVVACTTGAASLADLWSHMNALKRAAALLAREHASGPYR
jgi:hypothetical protein